MIDLTFKVVAIILFIVGIYLQIASKGTIPQAGVLILSGIFIFLFAQVICELRGIKEKLDKKN